MLVAAFAALALSGCVNPSGKAEKAAAPPQPEQTARVLPAPQPIVQITVVDIDACKDAWAKAWAKKHHTTVAAAERHARRMQATPGARVTVNGMSVPFTKTVWHSCEAAIKTARAAQATTIAPVTTGPNLVTLTRQQYNKLLSDAYQNPTERDPAKLISNQARVTALEGQIDELEGFNLMDGFWILFGLAIGVGGLALFLKLKRGRHKERFGGWRGP